MPGKSISFDPRSEEPLPEPDASGFFGGLEDRLLMLRQLAGKAEAIVKGDLDTIAKRASALRSLVSQDTEMLAKYKIELHFDKGRRTDRDAFPGIILVWKTGVLSGGGDEIMYPCPDDRCGGYIGFDSRTHTGETICPKCQKGWRESELREVRGYKRDLNGWAHIVAHIFRQLDSSADVYLKTHEGDIRKASLKETLQERRGDDLYDARRKVVLRYALDAILKDSMRSSLESRFKGLLRA